MATRRKQKRKTNRDLSRLENLDPEFLNLTQELPIEEQIPLEGDMGILPEEVELPEAMDDHLLSLEDQILSRMDERGEELAPSSTPFNSNFADDIPERAGLLLVGDVNQLPSVGAGFVLGNIINSRSVIVVKLNEVFRQASSSNIVLSAHSVNKGIIPKLQYTKEEESDFYFLETEDEELPAKLISLVKNRLPKTFGYNPLQDIQILAPMQRGSSGVRSLNVELQKALNPFSNITLSKFDQNYAVGDKVMQTENNYDQDVFNGDIGIIDSINEEEQEVVINFDGKNVTYDYSDLDQITLAYAITIHKSQGSEYPVVIIPITMQSYVMLQRNLIYTGITRGRKLVIMLGQKKALAMAVRNNKGVNRYTRLEECLKATEGK